MKKSLLIISLVLHIVYYIVVVLSLGDYEYVGGVGMAFKLWIYAMLFAPLCLLSHLVQSVVELLFHKNTVGVIKLVLIVIGFPLFFIFGMKSGVISSIIWNVYFLFIFIIQISSLFIRKHRNNSK